MNSNNSQANRVIDEAIVISNRQICREHYVLKLRMSVFPSAQPGQFIHIGPTVQRVVGNSATSEFCADADWRIGGVSSGLGLGDPLLRRAFSIAELQRDDRGVVIELIYRVVGKATCWMRGLTVNDFISVLGPLGHPFPTDRDRSTAFLVGGGVGLPPLLWLARALTEEGMSVVAFIGAQTEDLIALELDKDQKPTTDATRAVPVVKSLAKFGVLTVISTDDGSYGYRGYVGDAMIAYYNANSVDRDELIVYTCGPEPMMRAVADWSLDPNVPCYLCMERSMACGLGTCQSCVVPVHDQNDPEGWSYRLCCTTGPIFKAHQVLWEIPGTLASTTTHPLR